MAFNMQSTTATDKLWTCRPGAGREQHTACCGNEHGRGGVPVQGVDRPPRRIGHRDLTPSYDGCTLKPVVYDTIFLIGERPEMSGTGSTPPLPGADLALALCRSHKVRLLARPRSAGPGHRSS